MFAYIGRVLNYSISFVVECFSPSKKYYEEPLGYDTLESQTQAAQTLKKGSCPSCELLVSFSEVKGQPETKMCCACGAMWKSENGGEQAALVGYEPRIRDIYERNRHADQLRSDYERELRRKQTAVDMEQLRKRNAA